MDMKNHQQDLLRELNSEFREKILPVSTFIGAEAVFAFFGNLLVLCVFIFRYPKGNFRNLVISLASTDFVATLTNMPGEIYLHMDWYLIQQPVICKITTYFNVFTMMSNTFTLLVISVDRYRKICQPFGWQITERQSGILGSLSSAFATVVAIPVAFLWGKRTLPIIYKNTNITISICDHDDASVQNAYPVVYVALISTVFISSSPVAIVLYMLIGRKLRHHSSSRSYSTKPTALKKPVVSMSLSSITGTNATYDYDSEDVQENNDVNEESVDCSVENRMESPTDGNIPGDQKDACSGNNTVNNTKTKLEKDDKKRSPASSKKRLHWKTTIMIILTVVFTVTITCFLSLVAYTATDVNLEKVGHSAFFFFFLRIYFINAVLNPIVFGALDPRFREEVFKLVNFRRTIHT